MSDVGYNDSHMQWHPFDPNLPQNTPNYTVIGPGQVIDRTAPVKGPFYSSSLSNDNSK